MKHKSLKDFAEIIMGQSPPSSSYNIDRRGLPFFQGKAEFGRLYPIIRKWCDSPTRIAEPEDILLSVRAPVGPTNLCHERSCIGRGLAVIRPKKNKSDGLFLLYYLRSIEKQLSSRGKGSTFSSINREDVETIGFPEIDYKQQRFVGQILSKVESILEKRRQTIRLADEFLKSVFLEMFGNPNKNPKKWLVKKFKESFYSIIYGTGSPPNYQELGTPFIRATNIKKGTVVSKDMKFISLEEGRKIEKCRISFGDLILVRSGVNAGDCGLIPKFYHNAYAAYDLIIKLPYPSAVFFNYLINSDYGKTMLAPLKRRAGQPHLNAEQISSLEFITPPIAEQQKFVDIIHKVEPLKEKQKQSEIELQNLFNALMQKAFNGDL